MAHPHPDGYDIDETQKAGGSFIVARSYPPGVLEPVEASFHEISQGINARVDSNNFLSVLAHGNNGENILLQRAFSYTIRVIALVSD